MPTIAEMCVDLAAEHADLDRIVAGLADADWPRLTPAAGWSVADQIGHLEYFDRTATRAITDPDGFVADLPGMLERMQREGEDITLEAARAMSPGELLASWRSGRAGLLDAAAGLADDARLPWYGPPMSGQSFLTARLMETWAHGQDVCDTVGATREPTDRLRHIAHLGVITRGFTYVIRDREVPAEPVYVELVGPSGDVWTWGPADASDRVSGSALDFCLVAVQRRHVTDTGLLVEGPLATEWIAQAQAFAGPPSEGRRPGEVV